MASPSSKHATGRQTLHSIYLDLLKSEQVWQNGGLKAIEVILHQCAQALQVPRASLWQFNEEQSALECRMLCDASSCAVEPGFTIHADQHPRYIDAVISNRLVVAHNAQTDPYTNSFTSDYLNPLKIYSVLDASVISATRTVGVLCVEQTNTPRMWSAAEQQFVISVADLLSHVLIVDELYKSQERYRKVFDSTSDAVMLMYKKQLVDCNRATLEMFGCSREEFASQPAARFWPQTQPDGQNSKAKALALFDECYKGRSLRLEWRYKRYDGTEFDTEVDLNLVELGREPHFIICVRDITARKRSDEALMLSRQEIARRTLHDDLTGLPNRAKLHKNVKLDIRDAEYNHQRLALLLVDLDRFKEVNDTLGHAFGDRLIARLADKLNSVLANRGATLYRLGGDEFAVLIPAVDRTCEVERIVEKIHQTLGEAITVRDISIEMSGSVGVALYPDHGTDSHSLLRCADVAMYRAKSGGLGSVFYQAEDDTHSPRRLTMISELGYAIRNDQLILHFQPRIDIGKNQCTGCEALVRWHHPKLGMIPPGEFIPLAEVSDQIQPLGYWVLQQALQQARIWLARGLELVVSVNLSARNLMDITFPEQIERMLQQTRVPPHLLEIEITESTLIDDPERTLKVIDRIHKLGVRFAIDDFGTGYSSLSYLKRLPIDTLKIDRSFIKDMLTDEQDSVIVRSTLHLAHSFGLEAVAEGVEDLQTLTVLKALQCEQVQGFFFSKPLPADKFDQWLATFSQPEAK